MSVLRLQAEWDLVTKTQYQLPLDPQGNPLSPSTEMTIKLLTRCAKMYEAKSFILKLLKMSVKRNRLVKDLKKGLLEKTTKRLAEVRLLNSRIESQIQTLQHEHRIFKRPFIFQGRDYLVGMKQDLRELEA